MTTLDLAFDHRLQLSGDGQELHFEAADGSALLRIRITPEGPLLEVDGAGLRVRTSATLDLEAEDLRLHARRHLQLSSDGDAEFAVRGRLSNRAGEQEITAEPGDVKIKANDDVRVNGERILMNL